MVAKLTPAQIDKKYKSLSGWELNKTKTKLSRSFHFTSYLDGLAFVARVAVHAEVSQHHPEVMLSYNTVKIQLSTHDVKGLTDADFDMAMKIGEIENR